MEREPSAGKEAIIDHPASQSAGVGMLPAASDGSDALGLSTEEVEEDLTSSETEEIGEKKVTRRRFRALRKKLKQPYSFVQGPRDVVGVVFMEVQGARDLPPERNGTCVVERRNLLVTRTGFDMDPVVIVSFGKKTFRTKVVRHSLNPVFNERLIFQVMQTEMNYTISFNVYDRDMLSSNDFVAQAFLPLSELINQAPTPDPETGLYKLSEPWKDPDYGRSKAKRQDSKLSRILSRSNSSTNLAGKKGNGKSGASTPGSLSATGNSSLELVRSLSSTSLSDMGNFRSKIVLTTC